MTWHGASNNERDVPRAPSRDLEEILDGTLIVGPKAEREHPAAAAGGQGEMLHIGHCQSRGIDSDAAATIQDAGEFDHVMRRGMPRDASSRRGRRLNRRERYLVNGIAVSKIETDTSTSRRSALPAGRVDRNTCRPSVSMRPCRLRKTNREEMR